MSLSEAGYKRVRAIHISCSTIIALIAVIHSASTWIIYRGWTSEAVWFLGTGLCLLLVASLNLSHIGIEPCHMPTTRLVRITNWVFVIFAAAACVAIPESQAYAMTVALIVQALVSRWTLPGPGFGPDFHVRGGPFPFHDQS